MYQTKLNSTTNIYSCVALSTSTIGVDLFVFSQDGDLNPTSTGNGKTFDTAYKFLA